MAETKRQLHAKAEMVPFLVFPPLTSSRHILSVRQFEPPELDELFAVANRIQNQSKSINGRQKLAERYKARVLCSLFYEPSTRTRLSFETAATKFGMGVVSTENAREFSSAAKGETIEDTIKVLNQYDFDVIVLRHFETGAAARAAAVSDISIVNAGDGKGEHPTQALLDAYTIYKDHGRLKNLRVVMGGDLKYGRTVRSLAQLLSKYSGNHITFVSVPELQMSDDIKKILDQNGTTFDETTYMPGSFKDADVIYWTRLQKERLEDPSVAVKSFVINKKVLEVLPETATIMHPLPRVGEIDPSIDSDHRAVYFRQAGNGLYLRMALIDRILKRSEKIK